MTLIKCKIFRYNPQTDKSERFQEYVIDIKEQSTILDLLIKIKSELDGTLSFRYNCKKGMCGSCAVMVNNILVLSCKSKIVDFKDRELVIKPLSFGKVIRDLVIDEKEMFDSISLIRPYLCPDESLKVPVKISKEDIEKINDSKNCISCGICTAGCASYKLNDKFVGPQSLVKAHRFVMDPRDDLKEERLIGYSKTLFFCAKTYHCTEFCPKGIDVSKNISTLKESAFRYIKKPSKFQKLSKKTFDSIYKKGQITKEGSFNFEKVKNQKEIKKLYKDMMLK